ncbi:MAG: ABC-F family ATP-binding cassette domain-containing protein, partial [Elusimicrobiales bacterium]|nr:ABC-F family ATP-binding cassette domain-containing protein [Elusimicrobiales bacterium]
MITIRDIYKSFGRQTIFEGACLQINDGERFALVGPNGSGKSTLFKMLLGETDIDDGAIQISRGSDVGYLPQENAPVSDKTVLQETLKGSNEWDARLEAEAKAILMGLGFKVEDFERRVSTLSGGWAMRVAMANLLIKKPTLMLLDEPTNHLDVDSLLWFQDFLASYQGAVFVISHDRSFINTVCRAVVAVADKTLKVYHGDYENYLAQKEEEGERLKDAWKRQKEEIEDMKDFIARNRVRASTAARAQSMIKRLDKMERIVLPNETRKMRIKFPQPTRTGVRCLTLKQVNKTYDLKDGGKIKVYQDIDFEFERGWKMAFVGHNGAGKSTLLKILAGVVKPDSGERIVGYNVKTGYFSQHRTGMLDPDKTVFEEALDNDRMNSELMVRTVLGTFLFHGDDVFKKTEVLSGGEKSRLSLVKLLLDPPNILLMDEPTTHLDMPSVDALIEALKIYEGALCFISHDLYFVNALASHIVHIENGRPAIYPGNYEYFNRRQKQIKAEEEGDFSHEKKLSLPKHEKGVNRKELRRIKAMERDLLRNNKKFETEIL